MMLAMDDVSSSAGRVPLLVWLREGFRAGALLRPRVGSAQPTPLQVLILVAVFSLVEIALGRFEFAGDVHFDVRGWLAPWWNTGALLLIAWWALPQRSRDDETPQGLATWFALWVTAVVPANFVSQLLSIAQAQDLLPDWIADATSFTLAATLLLWVWVVAVIVRLSLAFRVTPTRNAGLALGLVVLFAVAVWQFPDRPWATDASQPADPGKPQLELSQETFENQQAVWKRTVDAIAPQRPGVIDVYGIAFAPDAGEDVFLRDSTMAAKLVADRFDAAGRVIQLVNNAGTADSLPWATPLNLQRALDAIGARMDRDEDVLVVYLTSHGASDFKLQAANPPLAVDTISPGELRQALDNAGIRNRVIVISACYSGGWLGPIADEHTLVMTASDATHTSYGCGQDSPLTYFGQALFDEQLRRTHSFEQAFAAAVPIIKKREEQAGKADGFSNPQILVGEKIRPLLRRLEQRLDASAGK
jgi:hypothetical protein